MSKLKLHIECNLEVFNFLCMNEELIELSVYIF